MVHTGQRNRLLGAVLSAVVLATVLYSSQRFLLAQPSSKDSKGTDFWLMFNENFASPQLTLFITGDVNTSGVVTVPGLGFSAPYTVTANAVTSVVLPSTAVHSGSDNISNVGIHVTALAEVTVYGLNRIQATTDAFLGLPTDVLGTEYINLTHENVGIVNGTQFGIVGTANATSVTIVPSVTTGAHPAGTPFNITLNQGQTYQLRNTVTGGDLSGTLITSNKPIAVFGSHQCANVPDGTVFACDHLVEELPPTSTWGESFVTMPLATRTKGDTFRFLAQSDGTVVQVNGTVVATLNRGQVHERLITGAATINASKPILVAQFSNGTTFDGAVSDPFMMLIPPFEQFLADYTVTTPASGFRFNFINVVAPNSSIGAITLDGVPIPASEFNPIPGSSFSGTQRDVTLGAHNLAGPQPFGVFSYGFDQADSYGYPGGQAFGDVAEVTEISLTPVTATNPVNTQHCLTARVTDELNQPKSGIRVDFVVTGANTTSGFDVTNASGDAQFCYTGANPGTDNITASVGTHTDSASKTWKTASAPTVTISPTTASVGPGTAITFTTTAADADDPVSSLTYEWRVNGIIQPGQTGPSATFTFAANSIVRVTVRDPGLLSGFDEATVTIGEICGDGIDNDGVGGIDNGCTLTRTASVGCGADLVCGTADDNVTATFEFPGDHALKLSCTEGVAHDATFTVREIRRRPEFFGVGKLNPPFNAAVFGAGTSCIPSADGDCREYVLEGPTDACVDQAGGPKPYEWWIRFTGKNFANPNMAYHPGACNVPFYYDQKIMDRLHVRPGDPDGIGYTDSLSCVVMTTTPNAQCLTTPNALCSEICGDTIDNNNNGFVNEGCAESCSDRLDNDRDGLVNAGPGAMCSQTEAVAFGPGTNVVDSADFTELAFGTNLLQLTFEQVNNPISGTFTASLMTPQECEAHINQTVFPNDVCQRLKMPDGSLGPAVVYEIDLNAGAGTPQLGTDYVNNDGNTGDAIEFLIRYLTPFTALQNQEPAMLKGECANPPGLFEDILQRFFVDPGDPDGIGYSDSLSCLTMTQRPLTAPDTTDPVLTLSDITVPATGPGGAIVLYNATATDPGTTVEPIPTCVPPSGSLFPIGQTTVTCTATDLSGNTTTDTFTVTVLGPQCALNVNGKVSVKRSGFQLNRVTGRFVQQLTLRNVSAAAVSGPMFVALDGLTPNVTLFNASGVTSCAAPSGRPVIAVNIGTDGVLAPGEVRTVVLQFTNPSRVGIKYQTRVLAGSNP